MDLDVYGTGRVGFFMWFYSFSLLESERARGAVCLLCVMCYHVYGDIMCGWPLNVKGGGRMTANRARVGVGGSLNK